MRQVTFSLGPWTRVCLYGLMGLRWSQNHSENFNFFLMHVSIYQPHTQHARAVTLLLCLDRTPERLIRDPRAGGRVCRGRVRENDQWLEGHWRSLLVPVTVRVLGSGPTTVSVQEVSRSCSDRTRGRGVLGTTGPKERFGVWFLFRETEVSNAAS